MLSSTFCHIPGLGEKTERHLWAMGCQTWDDLLEREWEIPAEKYMRLKAGILESKARLEELDHGYFRLMLPAHQTWRAYRSFRDHTCYIDIETTGLSKARDEVTTVCLHSAYGTKTYVNGVNMEELPLDAQRFKYVVSFNGARFDLPFLKARLGMDFPQMHLDLLYPLRILGHRGGLKSIEQQLGLERETDGVTGYDAVRMWHAYKNDREIHVAGRKVKGLQALKLLTDYNRDDTVNLEKLADHTVTQMIKLYKKTN